MDKSINLDEDGYQILIFSDMKNKKTKRKKKREKKKVEDSDDEDTIEDPNLSCVILEKITSIGLSDDFVSRIINQTLDTEYLSSLPLGVVLRAGWYSPYTKECLDKYLNIRPVPLKPEFEIRPYQLTTLEFMKKRQSLSGTYDAYGIRGGGIHLQMGLGKTLCALIHGLSAQRPSYNDEKNGGSGYPILVVASKTIMQEWILQIKKFFGDELMILCMHKDYIGKKGMDALTQKQIIKYDIVLTTYDVCIHVCRRRSYHEQVCEIGEEHTLQNGKIVAIHERKRSQLKSHTTGAAVVYDTPWEFIFADESQRFANPSTFTYKAMMSLYGKNKLFLSGTPIRNFCFVGDTRVITNQGNIPIRDIVNHPDPSIRVLSYNQQTQVFEYKKIENRWKHKSENGLITIVMGKKKVTCTPDHKFLTYLPDKKTEKYIKASKLKIGTQIVYYGEQNTRTCALNILNSDQEQVLIGSFLGDGSIRILDHNRCSLSVGHSEKQKEYCEWKSNIFQTHVKKRKQRFPGYEHTFVTNSFYYPSDDLCKPKTHISQNIIDKIDDLALAIWYLDDGFINKAGNSIQLATCSFDIDSNDRLCIKLCSMGIECKMGWITNSTKKRYPVININVVGVCELISRIYKYNIPACMLYKINCKPLLAQIKDTKRSLFGLFINKHNIPISKRFDGMIIKESTMGGRKIGTFKWSVCKKCDVLSFLCMRSDSGSFRCMMCRRNNHNIHSLFKIPTKKVNISNIFEKSYQIHPVTGINIINQNKHVYDIEVKTNHNFVIGSVNDSIKYGPVVHNCTDIWSQFRWCGYIGCDRKTSWKRGWETYMNNHSLRDAIITMTYDDANIVLPSLEEKDYQIELDGTQLECYNYVQGVARDVYDQMMAGMCDFACVLALFTRLRQVCIAPFLITPGAKRKKGTKSEANVTTQLAELTKGEMSEWVTDKTSQAGIHATKIVHTLEVLNNLPKGEKCLVFSMFTSCLDLLADAIDALHPEMRYVQIDGDTVGTERESILKDFRESSKINILFITYKVGSEGLNLTEATNVICMEPWWTSAVYRQAIQRCWRSGQTKPVIVHNIIIANSIEDRILEICREKKEMEENMLDGTSVKVKASTGLDKYTIGRILGIRK